jgi:hypothetical protein
MRELIKFASFLALLILVLSPSVSGKTVDLGPYRLDFDAPVDMRNDQYDKTIATDYDTLYSYTFWNPSPERVCVLYLHDAFVSYTPEMLNDTLNFWLSYGTVRVKTWNVSAEGIIAYRGEGVTKEGALQAYGYAKAFNVTQDGSDVNMFVVTKTVGLTKDEAERIFYSMEVT